MTDDVNPVFDSVPEAFATEPVVGSVSEAPGVTTSEPIVDVTPAEENVATESGTVASTPQQTQEQTSTPPHKSSPLAPQLSAINDLRDQALEKRRVSVRERHDGIVVFAREKGKKGISNNDVQLRFRVGDTTAAEDLRQLAVEKRLARNGPRGHEWYEAA